MIKNSEKVSHQLVYMRSQYWVGIIFVLSSLMLYQAQSFGTASQRLPQLASAATAGLSGLLLARNFLPSRVEELLFPVTSRTAA